MALERTKQPIRHACARALFSFLLLAIGFGSPAVAEDEHGQSKTVDGLTVYMGIVPAAVVRGHPSQHPEGKMHEGPKKGSREYHLIIAIFESPGGARVEDATVLADISGLGLGGVRKTLEPMQIAGTVTYGSYFTLASRDTFTIKLEIQRASKTTPTLVEFKHGQGT